MRTHPLVPALLASLIALSVANASTAPTTPTFMLKWGNQGTAPAQFSSPFGVATDALGNVYVVNRSNPRVQKFDPLGNFIAQWGSAGSGDGQFTNPSFVAVDPSGNVYVTDSGNNRVQKFSSSGAFLTKWGTGGSGNGQFTNPYAIAIDAAGKVYVTEWDGNRVQVFTSSGIYVTKWGSVGSGTGQFTNPSGIAVDAKGNVFVVDQIQRIQKFTSAGVHVATWSSSGSGDGQISNANGIATDAVGNLYVTEYGNQRIQKFASDGTYVTKWGSVGTANGQFNHPVGVAVDPAGNLYVTDLDNHRLQKFSSAGEALSEAPPVFQLQWTTGFLPEGAFINGSGVWVVGNNGGYLYTPTGVQLGSSCDGLGQPRDAALDATGNSCTVDLFSMRKYFVNFGCSYSWVLGGGQGIGTGAGGDIYVADGGNTILKYNGLTFVTQWGSAGSGNGQFNGVWDVAVDPAGNVYTVETGNHRVQKFTSTGAYITQWGGLGTGNGQFNAPRRLITDAAGNVFVADTGNNRVQKFTGAGDYLTQWGSAGSGNGTFNAPRTIAVDGAGNIYVGDANNLIQRFMTRPSIAFVSDVRNDQGRQVRLRVNRASADSPGSGVTIPRYDVFRRIDPLPGQDSASPAGVQLAGWDQVGTFSAYGESEYNIVVPTLADATVASLEYSTFMVRAATSDLFTFYDSGTASAFSVDNLSPSTPAPFQAAFAAGVTQLTWGPSAAADFETFRLHRGASANFVPGPGNLIATTTDIDYADAGPAGGYYKLTAVDWNGNESVFAVVGPGQTTDAPAAPAVAFGLDGTRPNPAMGGRLMVHFALPTGEAATLELLDVSGRLVTERVVGTLGAGRHSVDLAEGRRLKPGLYFVRLTQGTNQRIVRTTLLD